MERKILPLGNSIIGSYPYHAHVFSIVDAYTKDYLAWLYNYYLQLVVPNDYSLGFRVDYATPHITRSIPWLEKGRVDREIVIKHWYSMTEFVKECIERDQYVYMLLDVSKISDYSGKEFFLHDPMIYGFDDKEKVFYFMDNYKMGKYASGKTQRPPAQPTGFSRWSLSYSS